MRHPRLARRTLVASALSWPLALAADVRLAKYFPGETFDLTANE